MPRLPRTRGVIIIVAGALLAAMLPASGAAAAAHGSVLPWRYAGWLGKSGMFVQSTPQSLLVLRVARNSPAALAGVEGPRPPSAKPARGGPAEGEVVRILAINGRAPSELSARELLAAFTPSRTPRVAVLLGRRWPADHDEYREGPWVIDLVPAASARAYQHATGRRWPKALEAAGGDPDIRSGVVARMLFDAQQRALEGNLDDAIKILAQVPADDPGHPRALELSRQYERVTRQARKP